MKRESKKIPQFIRGYRILQYLRKNTDEKHPAKQVEIRKNSELERYMGSQDTYNDLICSLAEALNNHWDEGLLPEEDWRIVFDHYKKKNGAGTAEEDDDEEEYIILPNGKKRRKPTPIRNLYYQPVFSYEEIDALIEGIWFSKTLSNDKRKRIIEKIKEHLTSKYYKDSYTGVLGIREPALADRSQMEENLAAIREAINGQKKLSFQFNGYDRHKKLIPAGDWRRTVSPYYIAANGGRYYLIGGWDGREERPAKMCIYRIDLMTELEVLLDKRLPKREVDGPPREWSEDFALSHLNMFHDEPERIKLKITCEPHQWTFLHDWFGDSFVSVASPEGEPAIVKCSPEAMVHWALQYSDRVEVLEPEHVRRKVKKKIELLSQKYGLEK